MEAREMRLYYKKKSLVLCILIFVLFVAGCATTVSNIKSVDELKGNRLLVGRFVFYVNDKLVNLHTLTQEDGSKKTVSGFHVLFDKGDGKSKKIELDEKGYVYISVDEGQYYFTRIKTNFNFWFGVQRFPIHLSSGISVNNSDSVVNFGTIKVEYEHSAGAKATELLISSVIIFYPQLSNLRVTQTSDWDTTRRYISSKFNILPELIRDEVVSLSVTTRKAITKYNDELNSTKAEYQYSSHDWYSKGISALTSDNYPTVISCMSKAIELGQGDTGAYYYYRGYAFFKLNQYEKAIEDYSKSVELDPKNTGFCMSLIEANIIAGKYEGVLDNIKKTSSLPLEISDMAILIYLECIAKKLLNKDTIQCEEEFNNILKNKFTTKWSFDEIELWLESANIDYDIKLFIKKKTKLIKKHKK